MLSNLQRAFRQHLRLRHTERKNYKGISSCAHELAKFALNSYLEEQHSHQIWYLSAAETQSSNEILKSRKVFTRED